MSEFRRTLAREVLAHDPTRIHFGVAMRSIPAIAAIILAGMVMRQNATTPGTAAPPGSPERWRAPRWWLPGQVCRPGLSRRRRRSPLSSAFAYQQFSYLVFSFCLTAYIVLLLAYGGLQEQLVADDRIIGTLLGAAFALIANLRLRSRRG